MRIGFGFDVHRLEKGIPFILGGVGLDHDRGPKGHSDADALLHAITDAILGALALGDIGAHFPDTDPEWKGADSRLFLISAINEMKSAGYELENIDSTVLVERPKLRPFINRIRENIADIVGTDVSCVSVKATTNERMGFVGKEKGIAVYAVVLLKPKGE